MYQVLNAPAWSPGHPVAGEESNIGRASIRASMRRYWRLSPFIRTYCMCLRCGLPPLAARWYASSHDRRTRKLDATGIRGFFGAIFGVTAAAPRRAACAGHARPASRVRRDARAACGSRGQGTRATRPAIPVCPCRPTLPYPLAGHGAAVSACRRLEAGSLHGCRRLPPINRPRGGLASSAEAPDPAPFRHGNAYLQAAPTPRVQGGRVSSGGGAGSVAGAGGQQEAPAPPSEVVNVEPSVVRRFVPGRPPGSHKGQNGRVLVVGGSNVYHGAPILASLAALRSGADLVYTAVPGANASATRSASPDLIVVPMADQKLTRGAVRKLLGHVPAGLHSAAVGMGIAVRDRGALSLLARSLLDADAGLVMDGGALLPEVLKPIAGSRTVVTPHQGEFRRLFGEDAPQGAAERIAAVARMARRHEIAVLLKGPVDIVSDGEQTLVHRGGVPAMTVGGTGDVLAGLLAGLLARNRRPAEAAAAAVFFNGLAGKALQKTMGTHIVASDLLGRIPAAMRPFDT